MQEKKGYFSWLKGQLSGWATQNYMLWFFALGFQLNILVSSDFSSVPVITFIGAVLGTLCVLSINAAKSINGVLGIISALCFIYVAFNAKNYLAIFEQMAYIITLDLPILLSKKTWNEDTKNNLRKFGKKQWVIAIAGTLAVYAISGWGIGTFTNDPRPWIDAIAFAVSLTAGIMCYMRYSNQYYWWTASGLFQFGLWAVTFAQGDASIAMAVNSAIYIMNDILAFTVSPWFNRGRKKLGLKEIK